MPMNECEQRVGTIGHLGEFLVDIRKRSAAFSRDDKGVIDLGDISALIDPNGTCKWESYPFAPPSGPATDSFNGLPRESNFLAIGLAIPAKVDGTDFSPLLRGSDMQTPAYAFGAFSQGGYGEPPRHFRVVYSERYTYVLTHGNYTKMVGAPEALYDRQQNPYEMKPVLRGQGQDETLDQFKRILTAHLAQLNDPFLENIWAGGPHGAAPDNAFYDAITNHSLPEDVTARTRITKPAE